MNPEQTAPGGNVEERFFLEAIRKRATDIHIDPLIRGYRIRFRIDGELRVVSTLDVEEGTRLINQIKADTGIETGTLFRPVSVRRKRRVGEEAADLRVSMVPCVSGPKVAIRVLDLNRKDLHLKHLGLRSDDEARLERWASTLDGMILATGPTASGKTTTVYALLHELSRESNHVITLEDPVEYEIDGINQIQIDERNDLGFAEGIKASLRLDPDCLMVGEIREPAAAMQAVIAAVQGHVVLATMHSRDAASAVTRLRNFGVADHQIAAALGVIVNQRLVRKLCPHCRDLADASPETRDYFTSRGADPPELAGVAQGCEKCDGTGYYGRTALFEVWNPDEEDYRAILKGDDEEELRRRMKETGHLNLLQDAALKLQEGMLSMDDIRRAGLDMPWRLR